MNSLRVIVLRLLDVAASFMALTLTLRITFRLLQASQTAPFVAWVYSVTDRLMTPFTGVFPDFSLGGGTFLDLSAILSMIVYLLIFYALQSLVVALTVPDFFHLRTVSRA